MSKPPKLKKDGQPRAKTGPKPKAKRKIQINFYFQNSAVELFGGEENVKKFVYDAIDKEAVRIQLAKEVEEKRIATPLIITDIHNYEC